MSEGIGHSRVEGHEGAPGGEAGGMPVQAVPTTKKFFLVEYVEEILRGFRWLRSAPKPEEGVMPRVVRGFKKWSKGRKARVGMVVVVAIMAAAGGLFSAQAANTPIYTGPGGGGGGGGSGRNGTYTTSSTVGENSEVPLVADFNGTGVYKSLTITLTWTDEPSSALQTNQPDSLGFDVVAPNGKNWTAGTATNPVGGTGRLTWALDETGTNYGAAGWQIIVKAGTMGDYTRPSGRPCALCSADTSNAFTLTAEYTF
jgi:hypothetical protein